MKYPRTYHLPYSPGATSDDKISNDVSGLIGEEIVILEKLDGENCNFVKDGVYARSHASFTISPWSREVRMMHSMIKNDLYDNISLFGENMEGIHSIEYLDLESYFYLFNIREEGRWYSWDEMLEIAYLLDLKTVPVFWRGIVNSELELKKLVEQFTKGESKLGGVNPLKSSEIVEDNQRQKVIEGVVIRTTKSFYDEDFSNNVLKWVRKDHVTTDKFWAKNWKKSKLKI